MAAAGVAPVAVNAAASTRAAYRNFDIGGSSNDDF
jgi:hypothetical protein